MSNFNLIDRFFNPKSIALIGASRKPWGAANTILSGILHKKYSGDIYLINNSAQMGETIHNLPLYRSILDCPKVDLVFIIVPGKYVKPTIDQCVQVGITNGVIISSGFKESILYDASKVQLEQEIVNLAKENGLRLIGPNCNGIVSTQNSFYAFFGPRMKVAFGGCSYVTRGGTAGGFILMGSARFGRNLGINKIVNIGDACDLSIGDFIQYYNQDPTTKIIGVYTEGISDGARILEVLKDVTKPVLFYKSGQSLSGQRAALSHVGAIASKNTNEIYHGFTSQAGVIPVEGIEDMLDLAAALNVAPLPSGNKVSIFTFGGSLGVMMTDTAEKFGLNISPLTTSQINTLSEMLPEYWSHSNPVDITDGSSVYDPRNLLKVLSIILEEYNGLFIITPIFGDDSIFDYSDEESNFRSFYREFVQRSIKRYRRLLSNTGKPIIVMGEYGEVSDTFYKNGIPVYPTFAQIAKVFRGLYQYAKILKQKGQFALYQQHK